MRIHSFTFVQPSDRAARAVGLLAVVGLLTVFGIRSADAQCASEEPPVQHYTGVTGSCPCFVSGEEAGASFTIPPAHFPIEVLRVGFGWFSQFGGTGQQLEQSIHIYGAGIPNPAPRLYNLNGPILTDGFINEFNIQSQIGNAIVNTGPVTITLEFLNQNSGDIFAPSIAYDSGCTPGGANVVKASPGGWADACVLGVPGDWVVYLVYKQVCQSGVGDEITVSSVPVALMNPRPNPFVDRTEIQFVLGAAGEADLSVFDIQGRRVARLAGESFGAGPHSVSWDGRGDGGEYLTPGLYFIRLEAGGRESVRKVVLSE